MDEQTKFVQLVFEKNRHNSIFELAYKLFYHSKSSHLHGIFYQNNSIYFDTTIIIKFVIIIIFLNLIWPSFTILIQKIIRARKADSERKRDLK